MCHGCHGLWVFVMSMLSCYLLVLISLFVFYAPVFSCDACLGFYGSLLQFLVICSLIRLPVPGDFPAGFVLCFLHTRTQFPNPYT